MINRYESDHSFADNIIDQNYSNYIKLVQKYFDSIYSFIKGRNVIKESYDNLDLIFEDENNHMRIIKVYYYINYTFMNRN